MSALPKPSIETPYPLRSKPPVIKLLSSESANNPFALTIAAVLGLAH